MTRLTDTHQLSALWSRVLRHDSRLIRFAFNGIAIAGFYLFVAQAVMYLFDVRPFLAGFFAFFAALPVNYYIHKQWSFQSNRRHMHAVPAFLVIIVTGCALNVLVIMAMFNGVGLSSIAAQIFGIAAVATWNYIGFRVWAFRFNPKNAPYGNAK